DIDGDGFPDFIVGHEGAYGFATLYRNRGDGNFNPPEYHNCGEPDWFLSFVDLRRSGKPDLIVLESPQRSTLRVSINDGAGGLLDPVRDPDWTNGFEQIDQAAAADIDRDGILDLATATSNAPAQVRILRGLGGGRFEPSTGITYGTMGAA